MAQTIDLAPDQVEAIQQCLIDPEYFLENFCWLQQKASAGVAETSAVIPFETGETPDQPHFFQRQILRWLHGRENVVAYKSRRVGCSWIAAAYAAWLINFYPNVNVLFISRTGNDAKKILAKVKFILKNLAYHDSLNYNRATKADFLCGEIIFDNTERITIGWRNEVGLFAQESTVESITTTDDAGRGDDATFIVFDELAFYEHPQETWSSATKTLARGGHWMAISTPGSIGDVFHRLVSQAQLAEQGKLSWEELGYEFIRIHWSEAGITPEQVAKASVGDTEAKREQEWELTFYSPGTLAFHPVHLAACYKPLEEFPEIAAALAKYRERVEKGDDPHVYYYSGVDSAKGNISRKSTEKDWNSFVALTRDGIQAAGVHNQAPISEWAGDGKGTLGQVSQLHIEYPGICGIEEEGPGYVTANNHVLPDDLRSDMTRINQNHAFKRGAVERLIVKIERHDIIITDFMTYQSLSVIQKGTIQGSYAAPSGFIDDPFMALVLANEMLDREGQYHFDMSGAINQREQNYGLGPIASQDEYGQASDVQGFIDMMVGLEPEKFDLMPDDLPFGIGDIYGP